MSTEPMLKSKADYAQLIEHIDAPGSPVGIDTQLTHAIIIDYLQQIAGRLDKIERRLEADK